MFIEQMLLTVNNLVEVGFHEIHDHVNVEALGAGGLEHVEDGDDILVAKVVQDTDFTERSFDERHGGESPRDLLDRHVPICAAIDGFTDDAVGADADVLLRNVRRRVQPEVDFQRPARHVFQLARRHLRRRRRRAKCVALNARTDVRPTESREKRLPRARAGDKRRHCARRPVLLRARSPPPSVATFVDSSRPIGQPSPPSCSDLVSFAPPHSSPFRPLFAIRWR